jgi:TetR/AcrR family transcriptional regulator
MTKARRLGAEGAANRQLLIDTAEALLCEEGYAAVTARRVATRAGLKLPLVYYYFQTMDDLILAVVRKNTDQRLQRFVQALASPEPLRGLWELNRDHTRAISTTELLALANHRETIRTELIAAAKQFRQLQIEAVARLWAARGGVAAATAPAAAIVTIVGALTRAMAQDMALGLDDGYPEAMALVERGLDWLSQQAAEPSPGPEVA